MDLCASIKAAFSRKTPAAQPHETDVNARAAARDAEVIQQAAISCTTFPPSGWGWK